MQLFSSIKSRMLETITNKGLSRYEFYKATGITRGVLDKNTGISEENITKFLVYFSDINTEWLVTGKGPMFRKNGVKTEDFAQIVEESENNYEKKGNTPLLPFEAVAGNGLKAYQDLQVIRYYDIHEFKNASFLIQVKGDSMAPRFKSGDIIACMLVKERLFFQWNKTYVIYTGTQGIIIKRIKKGSTDDVICCVSNNADYEPFEVPTNDIIDIALVLGAIVLE